MASALCVVRLVMKEGVNNRVELARWQLRCGRITCFVESFWAERDALAQTLLRVVLQDPSEVGKRGVEAAIVRAVLFSNGAAAVGLRIQARGATKLVGRVVRTFAADAVAGFAFVVHHTADAFLHKAGQMVLALHILAFAFAVVRAAIHRPSARLVEAARPTALDGFGHSTGRCG